MINVAIIENTAVLRIRIQNLLLEMDIQSVEIKKHKYHNKLKFDHTFKGIDLILFDVDSEGIDINLFIDEIKKIPTATNVPLIAISSQTDFRTLKKILASGCCDFITKPFSNETFISKVRNCLSSNKNKNVTTSTLDLEKRSINDIRLVWNDDFKLGIKQLDEEHKALFDRFQQLYTSMCEGKGHEYYHELVMFLDSYVNEHFLHEEKYQKDINYDVYDYHTKLHNNFKQEIEKIVSSHNENEVSSMDLVKISLFIQDSLIHHVLVEDSRIAKFVAFREA